MKLKGKLLTLILILMLIAPACLLAATTATMVHSPKFVAIDANGNPLVGAKLYTFATTTTTPKATWKDGGKVAANTNPIILNSNGEADVWIDSSAGAYTFRLDSSADVVLWTINGIESVNTEAIEAAISVTITTGAITADSITLDNTGLHILDTNGTHDLIIAYGSDVTADRTLTVVTGNVDRSLTLNGDVTLPSHFIQRPRFEWKDGDEIYIGAGVYTHDGTKKQMVYWNSKIEFELESAGSNADSSNYAADGWHYIYLDDSAIATQASPLLDADCFLNSLNPPTYSEAKHGWYPAAVAGNVTTNDRCIFAVYETGGNISEFYHDGGDFFQISSPLTTQAASAVATAWADAGVLVVPDFDDIKVNLTFTSVYVDAATVNKVRPNGQTANDGMIIGSVEAGNTINVVVADVISGALVIEIEESAASTNTLAIDTNGWYFPQGM